VNRLATLLKQLVTLALALTAAGAAAAWWNATRDPDAWRASALAGVVVWLAAAVALPIANGRTTGPGRVTRLLGAMLVRMSLPLGALAVLTAQQMRGGAASESFALPASFGGYLVWHYLVGLAVEVPLMLAHVRGLPSTDTRTSTT
jgi:hypothetical protein